MSRSIPLFALLFSALMLTACGDAAPTDDAPEPTVDVEKASGPACGTFADVPRDHWAYGAIEAGARDGLWSGCAESPRRFCPDDGASRAMAAAILGHAAGLEPRAPRGVFSDVPRTHWAAGWIEAMYGAGLVAGCGGGRFCPDDGLTRAQLAALIVGASGHEPAPSGGAFVDVPSSHWAAGWIEAARIHGIMTGCADKRFCPDAKATRAQLAAVVVGAFHIERAALCEPDPNEFPLPAGSLAGLSIALDVGHGYTSTGSFDPGAVNGFDRSITEYRANQETARLLRPMLEAAGARVTVFDYARGTPERMTLRQKGARARGHDLFLSIHHNAFNGAVQGTEVLVDDRVATTTDRQLAAALQAGLMQAVWDGDRRFDRGVKAQPLGVLRGAAGLVGAKVLLECYFIDHRDVNRSNWPELTRRSALGIARGLGAWVGR